MTYFEVSNNLKWSPRTYISPEVPADLLAADGPELLLPRRHRHVLLKDLLLGVLASLGEERYRVTHQVDSNLPLTSNQKFRFGLSKPGQTRPKRNF